MGAISRTVRLRSTRTITRFRTHRCKMIPRSARLRCRNSTRPYSRTGSRSEIMFPEIRTGTEISTIYGMSVTSAEVFPVIASSTAMEPTVCAPIRQVMPGTTEIKESPVRINLIYTQVTTMVYRINRPEEIIQGHETQVFRTRQNPAKVIVPFIQITVISIHRRCPGISQVVDIRVDSTQEIKIHFIQVIVLVLVQIQFESHTVGQETGMYPDISQAGGLGRKYHPAKPHHQPYNQISFTHISRF